MASCDDAAATGLVVGFLADHPEATATVARWLHRQWLAAMGLSVEEILARLPRRLHKERLPLTLLALDAGRPVGTASLIEDVLPDGAGRAPFLGEVYVAPSRRRQGVGSMLCRHAVALARCLRLPRLCLYTRAEEEFFVKLGWVKNRCAFVPVGDKLQLVTLLVQDIAGIDEDAAPEGCARGS